MIFLFYQAYRLDCPPILCPRASCPSVLKLVTDLGWVSTSLSVDNENYIKVKIRLKLLNHFSNLQKPKTICQIEVRSDFDNSSAPLLEFCAPLRPETKELREKLMAWVQGHENKIMAYLQTALTLLSGMVTTFILKSKG